MLLYLLLYFTMNIIFNLNVSVLDTFVQRIMILTVRKLRIDFPDNSRKKSFVMRSDSDCALREGAIRETNQ